MRGGELNKRILIQVPATGQDSYGAPLEGWTDLATVWAGIADMTGRQYFAANAEQNPVLTRITIRYRDGINEAMRVVHNEVIYNIQAVLGQDGKMLALMCERNVNNG